MASEHHRPMAGQGNFRWLNVDVHEYKPTGTAPFRDVNRQILFEDCALLAQLRYFEIGPGGHTTLEQHEHAHGVIIQRGTGRCLVGDTIYTLAPHDLIFVPPWNWHQFRADSDSTLGILCMVNNERDRPTLPTPQDLAILRASPHIADFIQT